MQALTWARDRRSYTVLVEALPFAALLLLADGQAERAIELYALACTLPHIANGQWYQDVVGRPIAQAAAALPPDFIAAAQERGRACDVKATLDELIAEWGE
jgi:hypothetical protein